MLISVQYAAAVKTCRCHSHICNTNKQISHRFYHSFAILDFFVGKVSRKNLQLHTIFGKPEYAIYVR